MAPVYRFAPSPTGYLHIGGARTALFNWLMARKQGGQFRLRIEDTDKARSSDEMVQVILKSLEWLGLDVDGEVVFQGENAPEHAAVAQQLLEKGKAYRCFCTPDELAVIREQAREQKARLSYDKSGLRLSAAEVEANLAAGKPFVIRYNVDPEDRIEWEDQVYGPQKWSGRDIEDFVILRSDGSPLYNLSVSCDDHCMGVTTVLRGQDHLPNTPKQILLYRAMGWPVPEFGHLPLIMAPGKKKLSKRHHGPVVSLGTYQERGFLPEAFRNFLALLGWHPGGDRELFGENELLELFDSRRINKANAVVNFREDNPREWTDRKALHLNNQYIREAPAKELLPLIRTRLLRNTTLEEAALVDESRLCTLIDATKERCFLLEDFERVLAAYLGEIPEYEEKPLKKNLLKHEALRELLPALGKALEGLKDWSAGPIEETLRAFAEERETSAGPLINGSRVVLTGQGVGPGIFEVFELVGRERSLQRLRDTPRLFEDR